MIELNQSNFSKEVLEADLPVLVDFWAPWCGPCQMAGPVLEELAKEFEGKVKFAKVNVDEEPQLASNYGVMSIPTVVIFVQGREVNRQIGFVGKEGYLKLIKEVLPEV
ncbi:MAG: thioredoxin [candidate division WOR-3 bacterium]